MLVFVGMLAKEKTATLHVCCECIPDLIRYKNWNIQSEVFYWVYYAVIVEITCIVNSVVYCISFN